MKLKILAFGEVLWDIVNGNAHIGGAPLNFCAHNVQLGNKAHIISSVGSETLGEDTLIAISHLGIDSSFITKVDYPTGTVPVTLTDGIPEYEIKPGSAWDNIKLNSEKLKYIKDSKWDIFYFGSLSQREKGNKQTLERIINNLGPETKLFFDINLRQNYYTKDIIISSLKKAHIVKINDEELEVLEKLFPEKSSSKDHFFNFLINEFNIEFLCITYGSEGSVLYKNEKKFTFKPDKIKVVSTIGAGDSFSAALTHSYISTGSVQKAGELATKVAAYVVGFNEAIPKYSDELMKSIIEME